MHYRRGGGELELPVAILENVAFGYEGRPALFEGVSMGVDGKSRICLLGENGKRWCDEIFVICATAILFCVRQ